MPDFVQTAVKEIDEQLRLLKDEAARLEAALAALTGGTHRTGRAARTARNGTVYAQARKTSRRDGSTATQPRRRGGNRANQALELVREKPGITIPEIASAMKIQPNYLYRVLPRLASDGQVTRARARAGIRRRHRRPRPRSPRLTVPHAGRAGPPSRSRRPRQLRVRGLAEAADRPRRPTAGLRPAPPRRLCSRRSRAANR